MFSKKNTMFLVGIAIVVASCQSAPATNTSNATPANTTNSDTVSAIAGGENYKKSVAPQEKKVVKLEPIKGGITIKQLFANKKQYAGKTVTIKGQVTKFTPAVMNTNWIHIQDGTDESGKFDLVITSNTQVSVGDVVVFEGQISLDKDLGYGYFFEVIMEGAIVKK